MISSIRKKTIAMLFDFWWIALSCVSMMWGASIAIWWTRSHQQTVNQGNDRHRHNEASSSSSSSAPSSSLLVEDECDNASLIPYAHFDTKTSDRERIEASEVFFDLMSSRRSIRYFSSKEVPRRLIETLVLTAGRAPSGANKQPWTFCCIRSAEMKREICVAAEREEQINYERRMSESWKRDLEPLGTNASKPYLETAPWLIVVFKQTYGVNDDGSKDTHYYFERSIGLACGFLICAIHNAGLCTLTHTPTPMGFLTKLLGRPRNEKPYLLLPVGYPSSQARVPNITKKSLNDIAQFWL
jgi:iodotyrosine deiodinase